MKNKKKKKLQYKRPALERFERGGEGQVACTPGTAAQVSCVSGASPSQATCVSGASPIQVTCISGAGAELTCFEGSAPR